MDIQNIMHTAQSTPREIFAEQQAHIEAWKTIKDALTLMEKREKGLVVELLCKVGDTLYWIEDGDLYDAKVLSYHFDEGAFWFEDDNGEEFTPEEFAERIGKTVFLTRAEAEAALGKE